MEIVKGLQKMQREDGVQRFLGGLSSVELLTLDLQSAELAGRIYGDLERTGQPIGRADPMIAAIALRHELTGYGKSVSLPPHRASWLQDRTRELAVGSLS